MQATGPTCELARCNHYWLPASGELTTGFFAISPPLELHRSRGQLNVPRGTAGTCAGGSRCTPIICGGLSHIALAYAAGPWGNGTFAGGHRGDADGGGDEERDERARNHAKT